MKVRNRETQEHGHSSEFNMHGLGEIIVYYEDGESDSDFIGNFDVLLSSGYWVSLRVALLMHQVITDNYDWRFREPLNDAEKERGYYYG